MDFPAPLARIGAAVTGTPEGTGSEVVPVAFGRADQEHLAEWAADGSFCNWLRTGSYMPQLRLEPVSLDATDRAAPGIVSCRT